MMKPAFAFRLVLSLAFTVPTLQADLLVVPHGISGSADSQNIFRFSSDSGTYRGSMSGYTEGWTGICRTPDGRIYALGNVLGTGEITVFDAHGHEVRRQRGGVFDPTDLTAGPDGNLYVEGSVYGGYGSGAEYGIAKLDGRTGERTGVFINVGTDPAARLRLPTFGPDGHFYAITGAGIVRYDGATGAFLQVLVPLGSGGLASPTAMIFGPDGQLYVGSSSTHSVLKFDGVTGAFLGTFIAAGAGGLNRPANFAYGPDGKFYVASYGSSQVLRFDPATGAFSDVFAPGLMGRKPNRVVFDDQSHPAETVWFDDNLPAGASAGASGGDSWNWVTGPTYSPGSGPASGTRAHQSAAIAGLHEHFFNFAQPFAVGVGDRLYVYVHVPPYQEPKEIMLSWNAGGSWEHRAYFGKDLINAGVNGTASRRQVWTSIDHYPYDEWRRLEVSAADVGLEGQDVTGMSFSLFDGQATFDQVGKYTPVIVTPDTTPPALAIVSPQADARVSGRVVLEAAADDASGIRSVQFFVRGEAAGLAIMDPPYSSSWNFLPRPDEAPVEVMAVATDNAGNRTIQTTTVMWVPATQPQPPAPAGLWFDSAPPAGAWTGLNNETDWRWGNHDSYFAPYAGGGTHYTLAVSGLHEKYLTGATDGMTVAAGDSLYTYVYPASDAPPREIMLSWFDGNNWEHRAYWGENLINYGTVDTAGRHYMGPLPERDTWTRLEVPASVVGLENKIVTGISFSLYDGRVVWSGTGHAESGTPPPPPPPPSSPPLSTSTTVWFEDGFPAGASAGASGGTWSWMNATPAPQTGAKALYAPLAAGVHEQYFNFAWDPLVLAAGDKFYLDVYLDPANPPRELVISFCADNWEHRAYWGENLLSYGTDNTPAQRRIGALPAAGGWVRLEVPAGEVGLAGQAVAGLSLTLYDGRATFDQAGKITP